MKLNSVIQIVGKTTKEINNFFENWHQHTELIRLETIRSLRIAGHLSAKYKNENNTGDFKCPLYGFSLIRSCGLVSCQYNVQASDNPVQVQMAQECKNCLINCLDISKNNRMSAQETSNILGIPVSEINNLNNNAVSKIRRAKIKENLERYQIPRFTYFTGHCVNCETYIKDELEMNLHSDWVIQPNTYGWCSAECKEKKPKWQFLIENEFGCYYLHALTIGFILYKNIENLGGIFFLNKEILIRNKFAIQKNLEFINRFFSKG